MLLLIALGVGLLSWWLTGRLVRGALLLRSIDHPNERSLHVQPTPRTGGVAMVLSFFAGAVISSAVWLLTDYDSANRFSHVQEGSWILGGMFFLAVVSFWEDWRGLPVAIRFGLQLVAVCGVVFGGHIFIRSVMVPGLGVFEFGWAAIPITVLFLLWMTNLYNFMDGMDGFAGGMTVVGFGLLGYFGWAVQHPLVFGIAVLQAAAAAGFLVHNFPPAKIFMGDVGSISTGFLAGALTVLGYRDTVFDLWVPLFIFSPFILDATSTLVRRILRGEKIWKAHRDHFYQRVVLGGWGHRRTVLAEYALMAVCGGLALSYQAADEGGRLFILAAWAGLLMTMAALVTRLERRARVELAR